MPKANVVAIAADAKQFPPALFLAEHLARTNPRADTTVMLFSDSFDDLAAAQQRGTAVELRHLTMSAALPAAGRFTAAAYYRLALPRLSGVDGKLLYLDTDVYPEGDVVWRLFDLDLEGAPLAAVRDYASVFRADRIAQFRAMGFKDSRYFNSGVLLIDIETYARDKVETRALGMAAKTADYDQNILNHLLAGRWAELSPACNMTMPTHPALKRFRPAILHFAGAIKPWSGPPFDLDHPVRHELEAFLLGSPWKGFLAKHFGFDQAWSGARAARYSAYLKWLDARVGEDFVAYAENGAFIDRGQAPPLA